MSSANDIIYEDIEEIVRVVGKDTFLPLSGKTLLITGPCGLLGGYLVEVLIYLNEHFFEKPCEILGITRGNSKRLMYFFKRHRDFHCVLGNATNESMFYELEPLRHRGKLDFVIHAAGRSAPSSFVSDPIGTIDINTKAIRWLLERSVIEKIESIAYFSSSEIYGNPSPEWIPTPEVYPGSTYSLGARGCYTESKRCGEALCMAFHKEHKTPVKILRPMLVYGPGLSINDGRVMAEFMRQGINGQPIKMKDDGSAKRAYCYITDAMIIFWKIFLSDWNGDAFNIGNEKEVVMIKELANLVHELCGIDAEPEEGHLNPSNEEVLSSAPVEARLSMAKVKAQTGYEAKVSLREGLARTIEWARNEG